MLELCKNVLQKVSFDKLLFKKELHKSVDWLNESELQTFKEWCIDNFDGQYLQIIMETFQ